MFGSGSFKLSLPSASSRSVVETSHRSESFNRLNSVSGLNELGLAGVFTSMRDGFGSCINRCVALIGCAVLAASCVADDQVNEEQSVSTSEMTAPTTTALLPVSTTTTVGDSQPAEPDEPMEVRLAPGWQTILEYEEDFIVRSLAEAEGVLFVAGGKFAGSDPINVESLYVIDEDVGNLALVPWPGPLVVGDVANIDGVVVVLSSAGLWRIDPVTLGWSQAEDGDWSNAVVSADRLVRLDGVVWTPALGARDMAAAPFGVPRPTASWVELGDDLFLLDRGFWQYVASVDEWRELQRPSLASAAMAITRVGDDVVAADYQMKALRWDPASAVWEPLPDVPLRSAECLPRPISSSTFAGFVMCTGTAVVKPIDGWVTVPVGSDGVPVASGESLLVADPGRITRYQVSTDAVGPLAGPTVSVGAALFDIPVGWDLQHQKVVGETGFNEEIAETLITAPEGGRCTLTATYVGMAQPRGALVENRRGQAMRTESLDPGGIVSDVDGSDIVEIQCDKPEDTAMVISRLWRPIVARWLDPGPLEPRGGHSVIWTDEEMIVWGGRTDENTSSMYDDGAAYDPATQTWRRIAPTELSPRYDHIAVWTGTEMLIVGGGDGTSGAAYDPTADTWRSVPAAPFAVNRNVGWTWAAGRLVVWQPRTDLVAAFDAESNEWTGLAPTEIELNDGVLRSDQGFVVAIAVGSENDSQIRASVLDALTDTWRPLPDLEIDGASPPSLRDLISKSSVRDGRLLVWNQTGLSAATSLVEPEWQELGAIVIDDCEGTGEPIDQDGLLVAISWCGTDAVFDDADLSWQSVRLPGAGDRSTTVWTGSELLSWGDTCCYGTGGARFGVDPWRWTPPQGLTVVSE